MQSMHTNKFAALFPPPVFLTLPAAGIDISDTSIKYLDARRTPRGLIPHSFDTLRLPNGIIVDGVVKDVDRLAEALQDVCDMHERRFVNVALPEELVYLYTLEVPTAHTRKDILQVIEFSLSEHVPIDVKNAVFNYDIIRTRREITQVSVTVFPKDVVAGYQTALQRSGFRVKSFELEASSVARSVVPADAEGVSMVIDFGRTRTGITIAFNQVPIFSTTVKVGGAAITESIMSFYSISEAEANTVKLEKGIARCTDKVLCDALNKEIDNLVEEIQRHYRYWNTRRDEEGNKIAHIERIFLCGGAVGLRGLPEHLTTVLQVPIHVGNVWENMFSLDDYIPNVSRTQSWGYATAAGLLLRDFTNNV